MVNCREWEEGDILVPCVAWHFQLFTCSKVIDISIDLHWTL